jgi:hypothetical protein
MAAGPGGLGQQRRKPQHPPIDSDVVDLDAAFGEQLLDVAVRQRETQVPADRQHDHLGREAEGGEGRSRDSSRARAAGSHDTGLPARGTLTADATPPCGLLSPVWVNGFTERPAEADRLAPRLPPVTPEPSGDGGAASRLPTVVGVALAARYLPASAEIHVGGDWYDALALADGTVGLVIGDVAGHGAAAAAIMGQLRTAWRAYALDGHPPAAIIQRLHRLLTTVEPEVLASCCCVVADPSSGLVRWASAGHLDPLMRAPDTTTAFLDGGRTVPLGVPLDSSGDPIPEGQVTLAPGSLLLLYTDGLVERRQESLQAGLNRLAHALAVGPEQLEACCDHLVAESLADQPVTDDVALVAVRLLANPASATRAQADQPRQA